MTDTPLHPLLVELSERLELRESLELEFKAARGGVPNDLWPTVCAFANTNGGWIVLGVAEADGQFSIQGVNNADSMLKHIHDTLRNTNKISFPACGIGDVGVERVGGVDLIVIRVPAASRKNKPIYLNANPYHGTYLRRHSGDYVCTKPEVDRMMRDASDSSMDSSVLDKFDLRDINSATLARYRRRYQTADPQSPWNDYDDLRFLKALGGYTQDRNTGTEGITVAALLMFGTGEAIRQWRGRHLIDFRSLPEAGRFDDRWDDRVVWEENLLDGFFEIYTRLVRNLPTPFRLGGEARIDESPVHVALREALVNLLTHADYAETDASIIFRSPDGYLFRNPGSSRVPSADLYDGDRSDPRNPTLARMFRLIGLAEEAGTGLAKIRRVWRDEGFRLPGIDAGTERYEFALHLKHAHLLSDDDRYWLQSLTPDWNNWTEAEQMALILANHTGEVDNLSLREVTGQHPADVTKILTSLRSRGFFEMIGSGRGARYRIAPHLVPAIATATASCGSNSQDNDSNSQDNDSNSQDNDSNSQDNGNAFQTNATITASQWQQLEAIARPVATKQRSRVNVQEETIVRLCEITALSTIDLARLLKRDATYLQQYFLSRMIANGMLIYLYPNTPNHPGQRYLAPDRSDDNATE